MSDPSLLSSVDLTRREAMAGALLLVTGLALGPAACSRPLEQGFFSRAEMRTLAALCEAILPATDTPGARAVNVHGFIDGMMTTWASKKTRDDLRALLGKVASEAKGFAALVPAEQIAFVERFDAAAFTAKDKVWAGLKRLVLLGYYTSEIGATQELAYLPVPGDWRPDVPLSPQTRAWAE